VNVFRLALILLVAASGCSRPGAVRVEVTFENFEPGCLEVSAADGAGGTPEVLQLGADTLSGGKTVVGIAPSPGWSSQLKLRVRSFEKTCEGTAIEDQATEVTLEQGAVTTWEVRLAAVDDDQDGYAGAGVGVAGTDCDDGAAAENPGAAEECGEFDTNCDGLVGCLDPLCTGRTCDDGNVNTTGDVCSAARMCSGQPVSDCLPGSYVTQMNPLACTACAGGTFSNTTNAAMCTLWADCLPGQRVSTMPTSSVDRVCVACEVGTFSSLVNSSTCAPIGTCAPGSAPSGPPSMSAPVQCTPCVAGNYCAGGVAAAVPCAFGTWDDDGNAASVCVPWTVCSPGSAPSTVGTTTTNAVCGACTAGTYCPGGSSPSMPCANGTWDHDANSATACASWTACAAGSSLTTPGTATTDGVCSACAAGNYCAGGLTAAVPCASGTWDHDSNSATVCAAWASCAAGTAVNSPGSTTTNRTCAPCAVGTFSVTADALSCTPWTACPAGQFVSTAGTTTTNQSCTACANGSFSAAPNSLSCTAWSGACSSDRYEAAAPTAANDRVCSHYTSCLDRYTRVPSSTDGSYVIDPDGTGTAAPITVTCSMSLAPGGWTVISFEDFSTEATGWSDNRRDTSSSCFTDWGAMLGGYNLFGTGASSTKTYNFLGIAHTQVRVALDYIVIDSWDDEDARVSLDGTFIYNEDFTFGGTNECGGGFADRGPQAVVATLAHTANTGSLIVGSTLSEGAGNESFGIDNVSIMIR
jgi:hypothetical protein